MKGLLPPNVMLEVGVTKEAKWERATIDFCIGGRRRRGFVMGGVCYIRKSILLGSISNLHSSFFSVASFEQG